MRMGLVGVALGGLAITAIHPSASSAQTAAAAELEPSLEAPQALTWKRTPGKADLEDHEPERAQRTAQNGDASIRCQLVAAGKLTACAVATESPAGFGFGAATLRIPSFFKAAPFPQDRTVSIAVHWDYRGGSTVSTQVVPSS